MGLGHGAVARRVRAFIEDTRAGATAIAAAAATVMTVGAAALITDHVWLVDQRDVLKSAADAASIAATLDIDRQLAANPRIGDKTLKNALKPVARRYVLANLSHLAPARFKKAKESLEVELDLDRAQRTVSVTATADLGGTLFSRHLPLLGNYAGPEATVVKAGVETESTPVEVVLAIDITSSMEEDLAGRRHSGNENRMDIVKRAAKSLVEILDPNGYNRVAVGIVPWHVNVRLDAATAGKWARNGWARYPAKRTYPAPYECNHCIPSAVVDTLPDSPPDAWKGCFDGHRLRGGVASLPAFTTTALLELPSASPFAQSYFEPYLATTYRCLDASEMPDGAYNDCLAPRPQRGQANCSARRAPLFPLSTDRAAIDRAVDALAPNGGANYSALGIVWAQRMLDPSWKNVWGGAVHPADPATPEHAGLRKALVLLTDGEEDFCGLSNPDCEGVSREPLILSRFEVCRAAKARRTEVFVIAALKPEHVSRKLAQDLRDCSSGADLDHPRGTRRPGVTYVFLNNATPEALAGAFADIANQLRTLRKVS